ncbi:uncharacterized protein [Panulirus ornatus]|uniref:uncharacterized protein isoform X2 n=1 Tax=Panulirus ornatus TaxID=150431 RepID=UPI003A88CC56
MAQPSAREMANQAPAGVDRENQNIIDPENLRLKEDRSRLANWKRWGPYLSERQWGTVREDYSPDGDCWSYLPHDQARSRAYRWGEDGIAGVCDRQGRLCLGLALWNTRDTILKERLYGLTGPQGNHGEDVKELYYYVDSTPTHSYMRYLYKYPQQQYPYSDLEHTNSRRTIHDPEYELEDTGVLEAGYWDVSVEYAKDSPNNLLMEITVTNQGPKEDILHVLPTLWYRNTWVWGCSHEGCGLKPKLEKVSGVKEGSLKLVNGWHETLGKYTWAVEQSSKEAPPSLLFTENETNSQKLFGVESHTPYVKDAFHRYVVDGEKSAVNPRGRGTKVCAHYVVCLAPGASISLRSRLWQEDEAPKATREAGDKGLYLLQEGEIFGQGFATIMRRRKEEADAFYGQVLSPRLGLEERRVARQALAGLLWTKQFYHYIVKDWLGGDRYQPTPPESRLNGRNSEWQHLYNRDVVSMPDKWEYPWADGTAWMAFFCVVMLDMALTLAEQDPVYEDMASKYFEHFILIVDAINASGQGRGLWNEEDGFYYDYIRKDDGTSMPLKVRSLVGLAPLFAVLVLVREEMRALPGFYKRARWLIKNRPDLASRVTFLSEGGSDRMLLAVPTKDQLLRLLRYLLDEKEFLSPYGIRSLSKVHKDSPFVLEVGGQRHEVSYVPGESNTHLFGGNSNWRGPIWFPMNFLIITSLKRYHFFYGDGLRVECPVGSGNLLTLEEVSTFLARRLVSIFLPGPDGARPCHGEVGQYRDDPAWRDLLLFHEYFDGETGRGCGASHQTGWTALLANCLNLTLGYSHAGLGRYTSVE